MNYLRSISSARPSRLNSTDFYEWSTVVVDASRKPAVQSSHSSSRNSERMPCTNMELCWKHDDWLHLVQWHRLGALCALSIFHWSTQRAYWFDGTSLCCILWSFKGNLNAPLEAAYLGDTKSLMQHDLIEKYQRVFLVRKPASIGCINNLFAIEMIMNATIWPLRNAPKIHDGKIRLHTRL